MLPNLQGHSSLNRGIDHPLSHITCTLLLKDLILIVICYVWMVCLNRVFKAVNQSPCSLSVSNSPNGGPLELRFTRDMLLSFACALIFVPFLIMKIKLRSFKSSEHINEKGDGPYHG